MLITEMLIPMVHRLADGSKKSDLIVEMPIALHASSRSP
jgi:hypothetical protein